MKYSSSEMMDKLYVWKTFQFLNLDREMNEEEDKLRHCTEIQFRRKFLQAKLKISKAVFRTHAMADKFEFSLQHLPIPFSTSTLCYSMNKKAKNKIVLSGRIYGVRVNFEQLNMVLSFPLYCKRWYFWVTAF